MGLGLIASAASIAKTTKVKDYGVTGDTLMDNVDITILSALEMKLAYVPSIPLILYPSVCFSQLWKVGVS